MRPAGPPPAATWLLARLGCGAAIDSLAGDLMEEYHHGRSPGWYWRQVLAAVATSVLQELRTHAVMVVGAVFAGWVVLFLFGWLLGDPMFDWIDTRSAGRAMTPPLVGSMAIGSVGYVVSAWMVARLDRLHRAATVTAFLACALLLQLPRLCALVIDTVGHPRYLPYLSGHLAGMVLTVLSILLGGFGLSSGRRSTGRASGTS